jgi:hypothetical protein
LKPAKIKYLIIITLILSFGLMTSGCTSTQTVSDDVEQGARKLKLMAGDTVKIVSINRERFFLKITLVDPTGFQGTTLPWSGSSALPDQMVFINYSNLALIQEEHFSAGATAGAVATVTIVGAMVAAVAVGAAPVVIPPPP